MRTVSLLIVLLLSGGVLAGPQDSVVFVSVDLGKWTGCGSGTVVSCEKGKSLILSCAHVVPDTAKGVTITHNGKEYKAKYLSGSAVKETMAGPNTYQLEIDGPDLVILVVEVELPAVGIAKSVPKKGAKPRQWGFSGKEAGDDPTYKEGKVEEPEDLYATLDARPGDSGSGLFNEDDELVAVTSARPIDETVAGVYGVPLGKVKGFLKTRAVGFPKLRTSLEEPAPTLFRSR